MTIVLSTYNRPSSLHHAIDSVCIQSESRWRLTVIGDCCDERTAEVFNGIDDARINYVNLSERCGEQSGPNSVGLSLARTEYVAFLNHDDVWFPDHLATSIDTLVADKGDFFVGRAAFAAPCSLEPSRLMFTEVSPPIRRYREAFCFKPFYFEPCSSWVLRRRAADKVGSWAASTELYRTPLENWVLRAWRRRLKLVSGSLVTVLKPRLLDSMLANQIGYDRTIDDYESWLPQLAKNPHVLRSLIDKDVERARQTGLSRSFRWERNSSNKLALRLARSLNRWSAWLYWWTGFDWFDYVHESLGLARGRILRHALQRRTGETMCVRPDLEMLIADARAQLSQREPR